MIFFHEGINDFLAIYLAARQSPRFVRDRRWSRERDVMMDDSGQP
jgi:hypothetical protein